MNKEKKIRKLNCAIYTRKSTEEGLDQDFNTLDAQRESAESYIKSQEAEGWVFGSRPSMLANRDLFAIGVIS